MPTALQARTRWSAKTLSADLCARAWANYARDLDRRGFSLVVWRDCKGTFATVGERIRPGIVPEHGPDGSEFACIWIHAATEGEVAAFCLGMSAGEIIVRR
jgi:hypothetical protein